jgi:hypothetical protein
LYWHGVCIILSQVKPMNTMIRSLVVSVALASAAVGAGCASNNGAAYDEQTEVTPSGETCKVEASANSCSQCCTAINPEAATQLGKRLKSCEDQNSPGFLDWSKIINQLVDAGANALKGLLNKWAGKLPQGGTNSGSNAGTSPGGTDPAPADPGTNKPAPAEPEPGTTGPGTGSSNPGSTPTKPEPPSTFEAFSGPTCVSDVKEACRKDPNCKAVLDCFDAAECRAK